MNLPHTNTTAPSNPWDLAKKIRVCRGGSGYPTVDLEPGVKFFVLMLERLGATTIHSCEGHPRGFYVSFRCPYDTALHISNCGYFDVSISHGINTWTIRVNERLITSARAKAKFLREAATRWEEKFGKIKLSQESGAASKTVPKT